MLDNMSEGDENENTDTNYMKNVARKMTLSNLRNLSYQRRKFNHNVKNKIFSKLEREEIERAANTVDSNEDDLQIKFWMEQRKLKHRFPKETVTVDLEDTIFKACDLMFFNYVRHLVVIGDPDGYTNRMNIQGVIDTTIIMRYICKHFRIESSLHSWLKSEKSEESLFRKPLINLNIGLFGDDLIQSTFLDDSI